MSSDGLWDVQKGVYAALSAYAPLTALLAGGAAGILDKVPAATPLPYLVLGEATVCLPLGSLIDLAAEAARLQKELAKVTEEIARLHKKLSNEKFVANAPEEVVEAEREKLAEYGEAQGRLSAALERVRSAG